MSMKEVLQKLVTSFVLPQGPGEPYSQYLGRSRWDVWAGGILWLEERVSVTGEA